MSASNVIGFLKFIDGEYIDDYFHLSNIWLSNIDNFVVDNEVDENDLINDNDESRAINFSSNMPAFITCFTIIRDTDFDAEGKLNSKMVETLLNSENLQGRKRPFVVIPDVNMRKLRTEIITFNSKNNEFPFNITDLFMHSVKYSNNYSREAHAADKDLGHYLHGKELTHSRIEQIGEVFYLKKDIKYEEQRELRVGLVYPANKDIADIEHLTGISIKLSKEIKLASQRYNGTELKNIKINDFQ